MRAVLLALPLVLLTACATGQTYNGCGPFKPIIPSGQDRLTDSTSVQILSHDCLGYRLNCWEPPHIADACKNIQ